MTKQQTEQQAAQTAQRQLEQLLENNQLLENKMNAEMLEAEGYLDAHPIKVESAARVLDGELQIRFTTSAPGDTRIQIHIDISDEQNPALQALIVTMLVEQFDDYARGTIEELLTGVGRSEATEGSSEQE